MKIQSYRSLSLLILGLGFLSFHTYKTQVNTISQGKGWYSNIINILTYFPRNLKALSNKDNLSSKSDVFVKVDPNFEGVNKLEKDLFLLGGNWKEEEGWTVELKNLKSSEILKSWQVKEENYNQEKSPRLYPNAEVSNPILLKDSNLIVGQIGSFNLFKLNSNSEVVWENHDYYIHHAMNLDADGNIWVCSRKSEAQAILGNGTITKPYIDDLLVLVNQKDGKVIFEKSVIEILRENNLSSYALGMNGTIDGIASKYDPIHLNDIEPDLKTGNVWLSFRNTSTIMLYNPSGNKILRVISGDLIHQHDVDIINDSVISVFNNNSITGLISDVKLGLRIDSLPSSQVVLIDLKSGEFWGKRAIRNVYTGTEGLSEYLGGDLWFIEEQNRGKIHVFDSSGIVYSNYYEREGNYTELPHWSRVYKDLNFLDD